MHYLHLAIEGFGQWDVYLKTSQLERLLLDAQFQEDTALTSVRTQSPAGRTAAELEIAAASFQGEPRSADSMDLAAILRTTQAITNQMDLDTVLAEIMNTMMKHAGASKGALLTNTNDDALTIQAYADSEEQVAIRFPMELSESLLLPEGIIRYVFRTHEAVHYAGGEESWLIHNPYMAKHRPQSALCIPVTVHGMMLGVLYLENKRTSGVFANDRMEVLLAMASQGIMMCVLQSSSEPIDTGPGMEEVAQDAPSSTMEEPLTDRELEVLALLAAGLSNKEIADRLIIAIGTVKVHVKNIFAKLKVNRRFKAIEQAKELRLIGQNS